MVNITLEIPKKVLEKLQEKATSLHQNFYEAWFPPETVKMGIENAQKLIEEVKRL